MPTSSYWANLNEYEKTFLHCAENFNSAGRCFLNVRGKTCCVRSKEVILCNMYWVQTWGCCFWKTILSHEFWLCSLCARSSTSGLSPLTHLTYLLCRSFCSYSVKMAVHFSVQPYLPRREGYRDRTTNYNNLRVSSSSSPTQTHSIFFLTHWLVRLISCWDMKLLCAHFAVLP